MSSVNCLILAGGESSRMQGQDKAQLHYNNRPMIESVVKVLPKERGKLIISCNNNHDFYRQFSNHLLSDDCLDTELKNCGPLSGVLAALEFADDFPLLVLPCDTPELTGETVELLLNHHQKQTEAKLSCVQIDGQLQPLHCVIEPELSESLKQFLLSGHRKVADWVNSVSPSLFDCSNVKSEFANINQYSDLERVNKN